MSGSTLLQCRFIHASLAWKREMRSSSLSAGKGASRVRRGLRNFHSGEVGRSSPSARSLLRLLLSSILYTANEHILQCRPPLSQRASSLSLLAARHSPHIGLLVLAARALAHARYGAGSVDSDAMEHREPLRD